MTYSLRLLSGSCRRLVCVAACMLLATGCAVKEQPVEPLVPRADATIALDSPASASTPDVQTMLDHAAPLLVADSGDVRLISSYGPRKSGKRTRIHRGLDIKAPRGTAVLSYTAGEVVVAGRRRGYGLSADIRHPDGSVSRYAHMSKISVKIGDRLSAGDTVGAVGQTGRASTAHLHFEVLKNGKAVNPTPYLKSGLGMVVSTSGSSRNVANVGSFGGTTGTVKKATQKKQHIKRQTTRSSSKQTIRPATKQAASKASGKSASRISAGRTSAGKAPGKTAVQKTSAPPSKPSAQAARTGAKKAPTKKSSTTMAVRQTAPQTAKTTKTAKSASTPASLASRTKATRPIAAKTAKKGQTTQVSRR